MIVDMKSDTEEGRALTDRTSLRSSTRSYFLTVAAGETELGII